jgi:DNA-binding IclR family transcriptional regulator
MAKDLEMKGGTSRSGGKEPDGLRQRGRKPARQPAGNTGANAAASAISVLNKAMQILSLLESARGPLTLRQVVDQTSFPKTTAFRLLNGLVDHGLCEFDDATQTYRLGFRLLHLADIKRRQTDIHSIAMPVMQEIRDAIGETVVLSVRSGEHRVHIDVAEGLHPMRRSAEIGVSAPLHAGAASKVLLAGMEDAEIERYLSSAALTKFQITTITDKKALWREVQSIRQKGYAESKGELISGGRALAAPIKDHGGRTIGVIDILTPEERYSPQQREKCIRLLLEKTQQVSARLGYRG